VTVPGPAYDEVGSRTRQAWLRTGLGSIAVTLLVERGLLIVETPLWLRVLALVPGSVLIVIAVARSLQIGHGESTGLPFRLGLVILGGILILAVVGVAAGLVTSTA
jgi:hypothetical protein